MERNTIKLSSRFGWSAENLRLIAKTLWASCMISLNPGLQSLTYPSVMSLINKAKEILKRNEEYVDGLFANVPVHIPSN